MKTPYKNCPDCGAHLDPSEICDCTTKNHPQCVNTESGKAAVNAEKHISDIFPQNPQPVKSDFDEEAFIKKLKDIDPGCYYLKGKELNAFEVYRGKDFCMAVTLAFRWGFARGQHAEKNQAKSARAKKAVVA